MAQHHCGRERVPDRGEDLRAAPATERAHRGADAASTNQVSFSPPLNTRTVPRPTTTSAEPITASGDQRFVGEATSLDELQ